MVERAQAEAVGREYDREMMLRVRAMTRRAIHDIAAAIRPGMPEEAALGLARETLKAAQMLRGWHGIHVRFGPNTLKPFGAPSEPGVVLQEDDIYFIDIGPVWRNWEGDGGETFVVGNDADMLRIAHDVRRLFDDARAAWRSQGLSGAALYQYASSRAAAMGWELDPGMNGHRLADFPHAAVHKGALADARFVPSPGLWVLEIQIRHPTRPFSAFYEDLLVDDEWR